MRIQNTNLVGARLGISGAAVRDRLYAMGIRMRPMGYSEVDVVTLNGKEFLLAVIRELEEAAGDPVRQLPVARNWTAEEDSLLNSGAHTDAELSLLLGRSPSSIWGRRHRQRKRLWSSYRPRRAGPVTSVIRPAVCFKMIAR